MPPPPLPHCRVLLFYFYEKDELVDTQRYRKKLLVGDTTISKEKVGDMHASSSALKSFTVIVVACTVENYRRACCSHGFFIFSGLPELYTHYFQNSTDKGGKNTLPQQVIKVLFKRVGHAQNNDERRMAEWTKCDIGCLVESDKDILTTMMGNDIHCDTYNASDMLTIEIILSVYRHQSKRLILGVILLKSFPPFKWRDQRQFFNRCSKGLFSCDTLQPKDYLQYLNSLIQK